MLILNFLKHLYNIKYKYLYMTCGIYMIKNKKTGQMYVGQSIDIKRRWREHCNGRDKKNSYIDKSIYKYKKNNFKLLILCELERDDELLNEMEKYYIWKYDTFNNKSHYNLTPGGDFCPTKIPEIAKRQGESLRGYKHTEEYKKRLSKIMKDKKIHQGKDNPFYGKKHSKASKAKMSKTRTGKKRKPHTKNTKKILSKKQKEYQEKNKMYTLWDIHCCSYDKYHMYRNNRTPNPCGCFIFMYNGKKIINSRFIDFYTPELLFKLTEEFRIS